MMDWKAMLGAATNVAVLGLVGYALLRPTGPIGASIIRAKNEASVRARIRQDWTRIASGARVDRGGEAPAMVEFLDYECPVCRLQHEMQRRLLGAPGMGGLVIRHYPLSAYARSEGAALAAICADMQGRLIEMHDRLYSTREWITDADWLREARAAGVVDVPAFQNCVTSEEARMRLREDVLLAEGLGVKGRPAYAHPLDGLVTGGLSDTAFIRLMQNR